MSNVNTVVMSGNLTRDPELRSLPNGTSVCQMRLANNRRRKVMGEWQEMPNYFDVIAWGKQGENCARYLAKGASLAFTGEVRWREYEAKDGSKREAIEFSASEVQFLSSPRERTQEAPYDYDPPPPMSRATAHPATAAAADDDIPF